ncbi:hypothetical protein LguiA_000939 [Lonicera macranthoides]
MAKRFRARENTIEKFAKDFGDSFSDDDNDDKRPVFNEKKAYRAIAMFMCTAEEVSPLTVEDHYFKKMIKALNPKFYVFFGTLECTCLDIYKEQKAKVQQILKNLDRWVSCSIDLVRHDTYNVIEYNYELPEGQTVFDYMCLTVHFIDDNWNSKHWVLYYGSFYDTPADSPDKVALKCLSEMEIVNKISTLTLADGLDDDVLVDTVRDRVQEKKKLQLNGKLFHLRCCADTFRLMVEHAFGKIENIISDIRLIVFRGKSLPLWHIPLRNLQHAIELESEGEFLKKDLYEGYNIPSTKEWEKVRGVCKLVGSIYNAAEVLFETKSLTASLYLHNLHELRASLKRESTNSYRFVSDMARNMLKKFENYWEDMFLVLAVATVMDPRCKMRYIEFSSLKYEGSDANSKINLVLGAINSLYDDYVAFNLEPGNLSNESSSSDSDLEEDLPSDIVERRHSPNFGFNCLDEYNEGEKIYHLCRTKLNHYQNIPKFGNVESIFVRKLSRE